MMAPSRRQLPIQCARTHRETQLRSQSCLGSQARTTTTSATSRGDETLRLFLVNFIVTFPNRKPIFNPTMEPSPPEGLEEHATSSTLVAFDRPLPLLRGPVPAGPNDDPSAGSYVLAFRDPKAWGSAYRACESKITEQCEAEARIGCTISASSKCKPPWWRSLTGFKVSDLKERERCEEREMEGCFAAAKEKCSGFAGERCLKSFRDARVVVKGRGLNPKQLQRLVCWATMGDRSNWVNLIGFNQLVSTREFGATNYRASELLGSSSDIDCILGGASGRETS